MKSEIENIAAAWRRIFGVDLGRMRLAAGCSFVADHLAQFEGRSTPLVDAILAEIEFQAVRGRKPTKPSAEFIEFPMELIEFPEKPKESILPALVRAMFLEFSATTPTPSLLMPTGKRFPRLTGERF